jgi:hypothetical protein
MPETEVKAVGKSRLDEIFEINDIPAAEKFALIEKPKDVREYVINSFIRAFKNVNDNYAGTEDEKKAICEVLAYQIGDMKYGVGRPFIPNNFNEAFDKNLINKDSVSLKENREKLLTQVLPNVGEFPLDDVSAKEFTLIAITSLDSAIRSRAVDVGAVKAQPQKPTEVANASEQQPVKVPAH